MVGGDFIAVLMREVCKSFCEELFFFLFCSFYESVVCFGMTRMCVCVSEEGLWAV